MEDKKLKKHIYGKPQSVKLIHPPGFAEIAQTEANSILNNLWFPQKYTSEISLVKNAIRIDNIHYFAITELLIRSQCISDTRLILWEGKAFGKTMFENKCREIPWHFYLNTNMSLRIKVNSIASRAFHETGLKEILSEITQPYIEKICNNLEEETPTTTLYADLYKDKLSLSLSLAGEPLYKRGYRNTLSASAPLREDAATCLIQNGLRYAQSIQQDFSPKTLYIPFAGTGTFLFEYLLYNFKFPLSLFKRSYALEKMPLFKAEHFQYLLRKSFENTAINTDTKLQVLCVDQNTQAILALTENKENVNSALIRHQLPTLNDLIKAPEMKSSWFKKADFFEPQSDSFLNEKTQNSGDIFMPLNPPYGIRLGKQNDTQDLYLKITNQINTLAFLTQKRKNHLAGFILCPTEESWSIVNRYLKTDNTSTYHFTQGGLDIRVCQFIF